MYLHVAFPPDRGVNVRVSARLKVPVKRMAHTAIAEPPSTTVYVTFSKPTLIPVQEENQHRDYIYIVVSSNPTYLLVN